MACCQSHSAGRGGRRTGRRRLRDADAHREIYRQSVGASSCSAGRAAGSGRRMRRASITDRPTRPTHRKLRNGRPHEKRLEVAAQQDQSLSFQLNNAFDDACAQSSATSYSLSHTIHSDSPATCGHTIMPWVTRKPQRQVGNANSDVFRRVRVRDTACPL